LFPIATGLMGEAELPSVINSKTITHESSTLSKTTYLNRNNNNTLK